VDHDPPTVADRDPGRLLPTVLESVQTVIGELGDILARRPDAKDTAGVPRRAVMGIKIMRKTPVWLSHHASLFLLLTGTHALLK
jgi:hypothetical protein